MRGLSDLIVAHAVTQAAAFAVRTCCFLTNRQLESRASATRGLRAAQSLPLLQTAELQATRPPRARGDTVNALRVRAAEREGRALGRCAARRRGGARGARPPPPWFHATLIEFDPKFSPGAASWWASRRGRMKVVWKSIAPL